MAPRDGGASRRLQSRAARCRRPRPQGVVRVHVVARQRMRQLGRRAAACRQGAARATASRARTRAPTPRGRRARCGTSPRRPRRARRRRSPRGRRASARASSRSARAAPRRRRARALRARDPRSPARRARAGRPETRTPRRSRRCRCPRLAAPSDVVRDAVVQHEAARLQHPVDLAEVPADSDASPTCSNMPMLAILS